jgi:hypothetical protein
MLDVFVLVVSYIFMVKRFRNGFRQLLECFDILKKNINMFLIL